MPARIESIGRRRVGIASCPMADMQNLLNDASLLGSRKCLQMKQMQIYEKHNNAIQIYDSPSHSTLQLTSLTIPASSSIPVRTSTTICNNTYNVSTTAISFDTTAATTVPSNPFAFCQPTRYDYTTQGVYTTSEKSRSLQPFPWPSHRRKCADVYDRLGSYENPEFSGYPSLQQPKTDANGLNVNSTDRPCSRIVTPVNHGLRSSDQNKISNTFDYSL